MLFFFFMFFFITIGGFFVSRVCWYIDVDVNGSWTRMGYHW